jgi:hypothetical protein
MVTIYIPYLLRYDRYPIYLGNVRGSRKVYTIAGYKIWTLGGSVLVHQQASYNGVPRMVHWWVQCNKIPSNVCTSQLQKHSIWLLMFVVK